MKYTIFSLFIYLCFFATFSSMAQPIEYRVGKPPHTSKFQGDFDFVSFQQVGHNSLLRAGIDLSQVSRLTIDTLFYTQGFRARPGFMIVNFYNQRGRFLFSGLFKKNQMSFHQLRRRSMLDLGVYMVLKGFSTINYNQQERYQYLRNLGNIGHLELLDIMKETFSYTLLPNIYEKSRSYVEVGGPFAYGNGDPLLNQDTYETLKIWVTNDLGEFRTSHDWNVLYWISEDQIQKPVNLYFTSDVPQYSGIFQRAVQSRPTVRGLFRPN